MVRQEGKGIPLAGEPDRPVVELQDYQVQFLLLDKQNKKRLEMQRLEMQNFSAVRDRQDIELEEITSPLNQLTLAHLSIKELLQRLPTHHQYIEDLKVSLLADIKTLESCERDLNKKEAELKSMEDRYNELINMTPETQQGELQEVKDKVMVTMQQDWEKVKLDRDNAMGRVKDTNEQIAGLKKASELVPELIKDLTQLAVKLHDI